MLLNTEDLIQKDEDLDQLILPFSTEEIDAVVLNLPGDKAPGPDGFNGLFVKKAWHTIRNDVYRLCFDFWEHRADLKSINSSFITLVPKRDNPEAINDFRPISLLNTSMKIITKILANRL